MKQLIAIVALLAATSAHASVVGANHGNHSAAGFGPAGGQSVAGQAAKSSAYGGIAGAGQASGNGGSYSFADNFQPWAEADMRQFQKAKWTPYTGE